jgi:hypothetical protein
MAELLDHDLPAHLVARAEAWPWSNVRAHLAGRDDAS